MLYIIIGLPGAGKSTIAKIIAKRHKAIILNADEFRKKIFNIDSSKKDQIYPKEGRDLPYKAIFQEARKLIKRNLNVVIDAALYSNKLIREAKKITKKSKIIKIICPEDIIKKRLQKRVKESKKEYSAGIKVYNLMKSVTEKINEINYTIDTSKDITPQLKGI